MNILINLLFIFLVCKLAYLYAKRETFNIEVVSILLLINLNMNVLLYVYFNQEYIRRQIQTVANLEPVQAPVFRQPIPRGQRSKSRIRAKRSETRNRDPGEYENNANLVNLINSPQRRTEPRPDDAQEDISVFGSTRRSRKN